MKKKCLWAAFVLVYWTSLHLLGGFRSDHVTIGLVILALTLLEPWTTNLFRFLLPLLLTGVVYDSQRFYSDYIRGEVRVEFPYHFDKTWFGIETSAGRLTPNEWWQLHLHPALDLVTGFAYLVFVAAFVFVCAWFYYSASRGSAERRNPRSLSAPASRGSAERRNPRSLSNDPMWAFFWLNILGYSTYYWFPAAPPWYVSQYGLGPADMSAHASAAGCARFDLILGTHFFSGMYGRSADVFGAIPSLHVAYPFLAILYAFHYKSLRGFTIGFYLLMCFSAVYLNHHYVIDLIWGTAYAIIVFAIFRGTERWRDPNRRCSA